MSTIIIGIHGLGNKPPEKVLSRWWKKSIYEGLRAIGKPRLFFRFKLVYWADLLYPTPQNPREKDKKSPHYLDDPYLPANDQTHRSPGEFRKKINRYIKEQLDRIFLNPDKTVNFSRLTDLILQRYFRDLEVYLKAETINHNGVPYSARDAICERLIHVLKKHRSKKIMLISHSMGSIIAYDVLTQFKDVLQVHTLVTIGSPLGLPMVMSRIYSEQRQQSEQTDAVRTPENVTDHWFNFADLEDKVAIDCELAGEFFPNSRQVGVLDIQVFNNYIQNGRRNPHKAYGYLRSTAVADKIHSFLGEGKMIGIINRLFSRTNELIQRKGVQSN